MFFGMFPYTIIDDRLIRDITRSVKFDLDAADTIEVLVKDGERADVLSRRLYNTPEYDWTFYIVNNITPDEWPLASEEVDDIVDEKFTKPDAIAQYFDSSGHIVQKIIRKRFIDENNEIVEFYEDGQGYGSITDDVIFNPSLVTKTYRDLEHEKNDKRRNIRAIRPENILAFVNDFSSAINGNIN